MSVNIHSSSYVDRNAQLDDDVKIGPLCVVGPDVKLGKGVKLVSQVNIAGNTSVGADCELYPFVSIGHSPQDSKHKGGQVSLKIGARTILRETVNIHPGSDAGRPETIIGDDCYFMYGTHVAHEGLVGNNVVLSNGTQVGGCVSIGDNVIVSGLCAVHQFTRIGNNAFIGGMTTVVKDVIPFGISVGSKQILNGLNVIGLKRSGFCKADIHDFRSAYKIIFEGGGNFQDRLAEVEARFVNHAQIMKIVTFIKSKDKRPICLPASEKKPSKS